MCRLVKDLFILEPHPLSRELQVVTAQGPSEQQLFSLRGLNARAAEAHGDAA